MGVKFGAGAWGSGLMVNGFVLLYFVFFLFRVQGRGCRISDFRWIRVVGWCPYLTESVQKVVVKKSIPPQIRQLILLTSNGKG